MVQPLYFTVEVGKTQKVKKNILPEDPQLVRRKASLNLEQPGLVYFPLHQIDIRMCSAGAIHSLCSPGLLRSSVYRKRQILSLVQVELMQSTSYMLRNSQDEKGVLGILIYRQGR